MESEYHDALPPDDAKTPVQAMRKIRFADREHLYVFRAERQVCRFIGESDRVMVPPRHLVDLSDADLVHNHTMGTSFSRADIEMAIAHNVKQLTVVTAQFAYIVMRPSTGWPVELDRKTIHERFDACKRIAEEMANKLVSQHEIRSSEKDATIIHYIWVLFFHGTNIRYAKKELES